MRRDMQQESGRSRRAADKAQRDRSYAVAAVLRKTLPAAYDWALPGFTLARLLSATRATECIRFCRVTMPTSLPPSTTGTILTPRLVILRNVAASESLRPATSNILLITG